MATRIRSGAVLAAFVCLGSAVIFAQTSGEAIYKQRCQSCHGPTGRADSGPGLVFKVKPITDPTVKKLTEAEMIGLVRDGKGKMQPFKDELTSSQIKASTDYLRTFLK